ncbi:hypothetical protein BDN70DRAFT_863579 [Pholiota conissans]|uniref:Uncharacterized protein n=1 Tax=Pholiota conissans TaxID=109636 RepID=A0A9P5YX08_9AGAR|nr:hypothetical protein BDN70DRAFT_863579 [Pholiota conissans]
MSTLNLDILHEIMDKVAEPKAKSTILLNLSLTCRQARESIKPILFRKVKWPHLDKFDEKSGLHFFPEVLWTCFRTFHLDWPDNWFDPSPPLWGSTPRAMCYPMYLARLEDALPRMTSIHTVQITCPFDPPSNLLAIIAKCPNIKDFRITDTPLCTPVLPLLSDNFNLEHMTITSVAEVVRMGEGPFEKRYRNMVYFMRDYRRKYLDGSVDDDAHYNARRFFTAFCRKEVLQSLQISANFIRLFIHEFWNNDTLCPCLRTLILTGATPAYFIDLSKWVINRMPKLTDLRVLLSPKKISGSQPEHERFSMIAHPEWHEGPGSPKAYSQITSLAISNAYNTRRILRYTNRLKRLAICALVSPPRRSIALLGVEIKHLLFDLEAGGGNKHLQQIRLISEESLDATFLALLGRICPKLEIVEVEQCGYQDTWREDDWDAYGDTLLANFPRIRKLRLAIQFHGCAELKHEHAQNNYYSEFDNLACIQEQRLPCATYLASRVPTLQNIGFEYRWRMSRHEDRWLDFDILRLEGGDVRLVDINPTWYQFPEIWEPVPLLD